MKTFDLIFQQVYKKEGNPYLQAKLAAKMYAEQAIKECSEQTVDAQARKDILNVKNKLK